MFQFQDPIDPVPKDFFRNNRQRLLELLKRSTKFENSGLLFLSGPQALWRNDDDAEEKVIFEPFFYYLFGVKNEVDTHGVIEVATGKATLFVRQPDPSEIFWAKYLTPQELIAKYEIDNASYTSELAAYLDSKGDKQAVTIYLNTGVSPVSHKRTATPEAAFKDLLAGRKLNIVDLYPYGRECRLFKSVDEVNILRSAIKVAAFAHRAVMKAIVAGISEKRLSDAFTAINRLYNSDIPYGNIFCAGANGAFLHYIPSSKTPFEDGQLCLNDSGAKVHGYNSDITRTFPVNGKFTKRQRDIYDLVLLAQTKALELTKPGIAWVESHNVAVRTIVNGLVKLGLVTGAMDDDIRLKVGRYFMPHGLGHYIGLYVHDMPGLEEYTVTGPKSGVSAIKRTLAKGMVITVEPGIYFNDVLLEQGYADETFSRFLVKSVIEEYKKEVGGVRIEDMYLITDSGYEDLSADLLKNADDIEAFMRK